MIKFESMFFTVLTALVSNVVYPDVERVAGFIFAVALGVGVKLGYKAQSEKLRKSYIFFVIMCGFLVGYWVDIWATSKGYYGARGGFISAAAALSEGLISYLFANNSTIWDDVKSIFIKRLGGKNDDNDTNI